MALVKYSSDYKAGGYTVIDNVFIHHYLSEVPDKFLKVYLYGLYLLNNSDSTLNNIESLKAALKITEEQAFEAFIYFEECGIVEIIGKNPLIIEYVPLYGITSKPKKFKPAKYADFSKQVQALLPERNISTAEFSEYYNLIETYSIQPEALIMIISYCTMLKDKNVRFNYILKVAKDWAVNKGVRTLEACEKVLADYNKQAVDVADILFALGTKEFATYIDNDLYEKWTKEWGFSKENIIFAAKYLKKQKGNIAKLDELLSQFYSNKKMSEKEMIQFLADVDIITKTARAVVKELGLNILNISPVIDSYISPWFDLGYSSETLIKLAEYFFKSPNKKTLEGMNHLIKHVLFKRGLVHLEQINAFIEQKHKEGKIIRQIFAIVGIGRDLADYDYDNYEIWSREWKISDELILYAADRCKEELNAIKSMHILLNTYKNKNITKIEQAKKIVSEKPVYNQNQKPDRFNNYQKRDYSKEELNSLMVDINDIEEL